MNWDRFNPKMGMPNIADDSFALSKMWGEQKDELFEHTICLSPQKATYPQLFLSYPQPQIHAFVELALDKHSD